MALQPAAHRQALKRNAGRCHRLQRALKRRTSPRSRVNFQSIRLQLLKQGTQPLKSNLVLLGVNELLGAGRKTAPTSITNTGLDTAVCRDGVGGADPLAGPWAIGGAQLWVENSLAEMHIGSIADADHQPGRGTGALAGPVQSETRGMNHRRIGGNVDTVHARCGIHSTQVCD